MNKNQLFKQAKKLEKEANFLLEDSGIVKLLSRYGKLNYTGSYRLGLMASGDIDIHIVPFKYLKDQVKKIFNDLIAQDYFRGYYFGDYIKNPTPGFPRGYYIGVNKFQNKVFWVISIWFVKKLDQKQEGLMRYIEANLTGNTKYRILKLKQQRNERKKDLTGLEIYQKVFKKRS